MTAVPQVMLTRNFANEENWGRLVLKWALDSSLYPTSFDDFKAKIAEADVTFENIDAVKGVQFIQNNSEVLLIRLPPKDLAADAVRRFGGAGNQAEIYTLPRFYQRFCGPTNVAPSEQLTLLACRIGDYSVANCG